jgi:hypothetical protein
MRKPIVLFAPAAFSMSAAAQRKSCGELKSEIEARLKARGVAKFALDIVPAGEAKDAKEVESCDGGTKRITYQRS